jgi:hypothetical protein
VGPERVALSAPAIAEEVTLGRRGEQPGVEELIPNEPLNESAKPFSHGDPGSM